MDSVPSAVLIISVAISVACGIPHRIEVQTDIQPVIKSARVQSFGDPSGSQPAYDINLNREINPFRPFSDVEDFSRINSWTYKGLSWSGKVETTNQFNLTQPPSQDKDVIICFTQSRHSTLIKEFSLNTPVINVNFTMKYYIRIFDQNFTVKGMLFDSENTSKSHKLFNFDYDHFTLENNSWVTFTATDSSQFVPDNRTNINFTVRLEFWSTSMVYDTDASHYQFVAFDELSLTGDEKITNLPQVNTKAPVQNNTTVTVSPTIAPAVNKTTVANTTVPQVNETTLAPYVNETGVPSGNNVTFTITTDGNSENNTTELPRVFSK